MEPDKIKAIEERIAHFKEIEDTLTPEAKQIFLTEVNNLVLSLNKDTEEYLAEMKQIELSQA